MNEIKDLIQLKSEFKDMMARVNKITSTKWELGSIYDALDARISDAKIKYANEKLMEELGK